MWVHKQSTEHNTAIEKSSRRKEQSPKAANIWHPAPFTPLKWKDLLTVQVASKRP